MGQQKIRIQNHWFIRSNKGPGRENPLLFYSKLCFLCSVQADKESTRSRQGGDKEDKETRMADKEESSRQGGVEKRTLDCLNARICASESYLDTTELETLPYSNDQGLRPGNGNSIKRPRTLTEHLDIVHDDDDDDALKLVREIFFK